MRLWLENLWHTAVAIGRKEFLHATRNTMILRMTAVLQCVQLVLLGFIDVRAQDFPTVIVDQDRSAYSRELVQKLAATKTFDVKFTTTSIQQGRDHVRAGRARIALVIPPDFHEERARGATARLMALVDGTDSTVSAGALTAIHGVADEIETETKPDDRDAPDSLVVHSILLFNPEGRTSYFMLPALLAVVLAAMYTSLSGMALVQERTTGTLERLLMSPVDFAGFMLGKLAPYLCLGLANAALLLLIMRWGGGVPIRGSLFFLGLALAAYLLTVLSIGIYIAANAKSPMEVNVRAAQLAILTFFLSGYIFPLTSLPSWLLPVAYALPQTHMIEIMRAATLRDATLTDLWMHFAFLFGAPFVVLGAAVRAFRRTIHV